MITRWEQETAFSIPRLGITLLSLCDRLSELAALFACCFIFSQGNGGDAFWRVSITAQ